MPLACLSRWCRWFLFLDLLKIIYKEKSYVQSKLQSSPRDQVCTQIISRNAKVLQRGVEPTRHYLFITPPHLLLWPSCMSDLEGRIATLIGRNFLLSKYFLVNPKIKIIGIIEINTLVAFILRSYQPQYEISEISLILGVLAEIPTPI